MAQTKKSFTLDDLMWGGNNYWNIQPKYFSATFWGEKLIQLDVENVTQLTDEKGQKISAQKLFTIEEVNAAIDTAQVGKVYNLMDATFPYPQQTLVLLSTSKERLLYNWKTKKTEWKQERTEGEQSADFCKESRNVAYVNNWNLYVRTSEGKTLQISQDGSREIVYGQSVHRDEFGIRKGTFWSPSGRLLAFYRMDQSMVTDYPLVDIDKRVAQLAPEKYPMAGMTSHQVTVGVLNPSTGKTIYLKTADPTDRYFTNISWSPDEQTLYMFELPRSQDKAELVAYNTQTGECKGTIYTETNSRYVEPCNPIQFLPWDASKFIMQSRRDGWNHIYLFDNTGKMLKQLTQGDFEVTEVIGFNKKDQSVIYQSNEASPICYNSYSVNVANGKRTLLDNGQGVHYAKLSNDGKFLLDRWSSPDCFKQIDIVSTSKQKVLSIHHNDTPWKDYNVPEISCGSIKAADGKTDLFYRLVKPVGFDSLKKYPTVVYVYGGPHAHNVEESWNYLTRPWEIYMAQRGYAVFVIDNRGSENRGFEFESCTYRHLGDIEMQDQMEGVKFLKTLPWIDSERLGVHGWSFGGFMTINLMCSYPEVFKVGVAGGPVIDWKFYEVMYGERYMDTPDENPDGYASSSLLQKAKNLKGRLQIIVGYNDPTCVLQHSLSFLRTCEDLDIQPDYFVYPGDGHNMMGHDMVHLHERITRYFDDFLK